MKLDKALSAVAKKMGSKFTLKGRDISNEEVFSTTGLLPGLAKRADQLCSLCFGYGMGVTFEDTEKSLLGFTVKFDDHTPDVLRLFCITDVLNEIIKASPSKKQIAMDELMYD